MATDGRDLLLVLKNELAFLEKGGYRNTVRAAWRPQFIFQDSPTCLNFDPQQPLQPCTACAMLQLVPEGFAERKVPCRFISVGGEGRTIDWYYRHGTQEELEAALSQWLKQTIAGLETERAEQQSREHTPEIHVRGHFVGA
jgi:hypothetical protein